ncbi:MAG: hypothetical protein V1722_02880 [Candidatus Micrarchaeota archaeon]
MSLLPSEMAKLKITASNTAAKKEEDPVVVMPTFVPAQMDKNSSMLNVTTRQNFINGGISTWMTWHASRVFGILCAVAALFLLSVNLWLAAGAAVLAGHFYSEHVKVSKYIERNLTKRKILYTR